MDTWKRPDTYHKVGNSKIKLPQSGYPNLFPNMDQWDGSSWSTCINEMDF